MREDLVVEIRAEKVLSGRDELKAHQRREHAAEQEEHKRRDEIAAADRLVVGVASQPKGRAGRPTSARARR